MFWRASLAGILLFALALALREGRPHISSRPTTLIVTQSAPLRAGSDVPIQEPNVRFNWPAQGPITSYMDRTHPLGIDIGLARDPYQPILATARGVVTFAGGTECCGYGYYVTVDHGNGVSTLYAHLSTIMTKEGDKVEPGRMLGLAGDTGFSTGNHLHFEVHVGDALVDPLVVLRTGQLPPGVEGAPN
jgi:murein DD-endopeptidase MepM/ murein hydrolase activator NlpD